MPGRFRGGLPDLVEQANLLWDTREKMAAVRQKSSEARWNSLTNTFTYLYGTLLPTNIGLADISKDSRQL